MYMEHDGPPDTKPRGSSGYLHGGVSGEKPAPTAEEVAAARQHATWLRDQFTERTRIEDVAVTLLAALDAAEARAGAAEVELRERQGADVSIRVNLATAERERDEARALAVPPGAIVVRDSPETRERIARKLNATHREFAQTPNSLCYDCDCPDQDDNAPPPFDEMCDGCKSSQMEEADAVLAALRESRL